MKKIVVFGGTGFIGREFLRMLVNTQVAHGCTHVVVVSRSSAFAEKLSTLLARARESGLGTLQGEVVVCDLIEQGITPVLSAHLAECEAVFYALQFPGQPVQNHAKGYTYERYDFGGLACILEGPLAQRPARVVYLSGAGAGQHRTQDWFRAKDAAEALLTRWCSASGGSALALRPSLVFGAEDVSLNRILAAARKTRLCPLFGAGDTLLHPIWVKDLARALVELGFVKNSEGGFAVEGAHNLPGPRGIEFRTLLAQLFQVAGAKATFVPVPLGIARFGAGLLSLLPAPPLTPEAIEFLTIAPEMPLPEEGPVRAALEAQRARFTLPIDAFATYAQRS